ncbi:MAG: ATP/GTP-binding protein [Candidatus Thorarchaeota archaeon]
MLIDWSQRIIQTKIVYYGPAMSGKTASIRALFHRLGILSRLESIETTSGRTLFFDYGPIELTHGDWSLQIHIWSATGQDYYAETRSTVLAGTDGIVFVADSNPSLIADNHRCWEELKGFFGVKLQTDIPIVFALNKRDILPYISRLEFINALELNGSSIIFETIATQGTFTLELLQEVLRKILLGSNLAQPKQIGI